MKALGSGILGFILGSALGALIGLGVLNQTKKSQRATMFPIAMGACVLVFGIGGAWKFYKWEVDAEETRKQNAIWETQRIELAAKQKVIDDKTALDKELLGISNGSTVYNKPGKYWVGTTKWTDLRDNKTHTIITSKNSASVLASSLNGREIIQYTVTAANKDTVPELHERTLRKVFSKIYNAYQQDKDFDVDAISQ